MQYAALVREATCQHPFPLLELPLELVHQIVLRHARCVWLLVCRTTAELFASMRGTSSVLALMAKHQRILESPEMWPTMIMRGTDWACFNPAFREKLVSALAESVRFGSPGEDLFWGAISHLSRTTMDDNVVTASDVRCTAAEAIGLSGRFDLLERFAASGSAFDWHGRRHPSPSIGRGTISVPWPPDGPKASPTAFEFPVVLGSSAEGATSCCIEPNALTRSGETLSLAVGLASTGRWEMLSAWCRFARRHFPYAQADGLGISLGALEAAGTRSVADFVPL